MSTGHNNNDSGCEAVILIARGYDAGFVSRCVGELREAGIRTHLVGLESKYIKSWHGVNIKADDLLRNWQPSPYTRLVVFPGRSKCVAALAREPKVPALVRKILRQDGQVAVAHSAESILSQQVDTLPRDMRILPDLSHTSQILRQGTVEDRAFIHSLVDGVV